MKRLLIVYTLTTLSGCAVNSGVVPLGPDTYTISHQGSGFWTMPNSLRNEALKEANQYCNSNGKSFRVVSMEMLPQIPLGVPGGPRFPIAEVQFMCLDKGDADLTRPRMEEGADIIIEIGNVERKEWTSLPEFTEAVWRA